MSEAVGTVFIELTLDGTKYNAALKEAGQQGTQFATKHDATMNKMKGSWGLLMTVVTAAASAINVHLVKMGAEAMQVEESFALMAKSMDLNANAIIEGMEKATKGTIDSSDLMRKSIILMSQGWKEGDFVRLAETARTAALLSGQSVESAFNKIMLAAETGMPRTLRRMGMVTKEQMNLIQRAVSEGMEPFDAFNLVIEQAALRQMQLGERTITASEVIQKFYAQVHEAKEQMGKWIIEGLQKAWVFMQFLAVGAMGAAAALVKFVEMTVAAIMWFGKVTGVDTPEEIKKQEKQIEALQQTYNDLKGAQDELTKKTIENWEKSGTVGKAYTKEDIANQKKKIAAIEAELRAKAYGAKIAKSELEVLKALNKEVLDLEEIRINTEKKLNEDAISHNAQVRKQAGMEENAAEVIAIKERMDAIRADQAERLALIQKERELRLTEIQKEASARSKNERDVIGNAKFIYNKTVELDAQLNTKRAKLAEDTTTEIEKLNNELAEKQRAAYDAEVKSNADFYGTIVGYAATAYQYQTDLLEEQKNKYVMQKKDQLAVDKWYIQESQKAFEKYAEAEGTISERLTADITKKRREMGDQSKQYWEVISKGMAESEVQISAFLFDSLKGHAKSWREYMEGLYNAILKAWTDMLAKKLMLWIEEQAQEAVAASASSSGSSLLKLWDTLVGMLGFGSLSAGGGETPLYGEGGGLGAAADIYHGGGVVGQTAVPTTIMPSSLFIGAPRLHSGLRSDESPAILQKGETVIPKGGSAVPNFNVTINAVDARSFYELCRTNPGAIVDPIYNSWRSGKGVREARDLMKG